MKLSAVATIQTNFPEAHFWLVRRGSAEAVGLPTKVFNPEHIGIRVTDFRVVLPDYLFYSLAAIHRAGEWEKKATGTLRLVNIRVRDIQNIELSPR